MTCNQFISCVNCCFDALQELSGVYRRLDEAKQQIVGLQNEQAQLFAKCEAKTQSAAMATAEVVTMKQELGDSCEHAQAVAADLASAQEVSPHMLPVLCSDCCITLSSQLLQIQHLENGPLCMQAESLLKGDRHVFTLYSCVCKPPTWT